MSCQQNQYLFPALAELPLEETTFDAVHDSPLDMSTTSPFDNFNDPSLTSSTMDLTNSQSHQSQSSSSPSDLDTSVPPAGYSICRSTHDFTKLEWNPPMYSDDLWIALKLAFPHIKSDQERRGEAVRQFLLQEKLQNDLAWDAFCTSSFMPEPPQTGEFTSFDAALACDVPAVASQAGTEGFLDLSPASENASAPLVTEGSQELGQTTQTLAAATPGPMMSVLDLSMAPANERKRRMPTQQERAEVKEKRRLGTVCPECKRRKKKCPHALPSTRPSSSSPTAPRVLNSPRDSANAASTGAGSVSQTPELSNNTSPSQSVDDWLDEDWTDFIVLPDEKIPTTSPAVRAQSSTPPSLFNSDANFAFQFGSRRAYKSKDAADQRHTSQQTGNVNLQGRGVPACPGSLECRPSIPLTTNSTALPTRNAGGAASGSPAAVGVPTSRGLQSLNGQHATQSSGSFGVGTRLTHTEGLASSNYKANAQCANQASQHGRPSPTNGQAQAEALPNATSLRRTDQASNTRAVSISQAIGSPESYSQQASNAFASTHEANTRARIRATGRLAETGGSISHSQATPSQSPPRTDSSTAITDNGACERQAVRTGLGRYHSSAVAEGLELSPEQIWCISLGITQYVSTFMSSLRILEYAASRPDDFHQASMPQSPIDISSGKNAQCA